MREAVRRDEEAVGTATNEGQVLAFDRTRGRDDAAARLVALVAADRQVPTILLLHPSRCGAAVAEARQLSMYLMHVVLGRTYAQVGGFFGRDRTTVSHACAHIEDLRDSPQFEAEVSQLEAAIGSNADATGERRYAAG